MSPGLAVTPAAFLVIAGVGAVGVALFLLAGWRGRWSVWVAGYFLIVLALALALVLRNDGRALSAGPEPGPGAVVSVVHGGP